MCGNLKAKGLPRYINILLWAFCGKFLIWCSVLISMLSDNLKILFQANQTLSSLSYCMEQASVLVF